MSKFQVGDRVLISKDSPYYGKDPANPLDIAGTITRISEYDLPIVVKFDNDMQNRYGVADLVLCSNWKSEAIRLHSEGVSYHEIAAALNKKYHTVYRHISRQATPVVPDVCVPSEVIMEAIKSTVVHPKLPTIFVIGDTQVKQGISLDYIHWVGNYIAKKKPGIIVNIGDWYDMQSLSSYDKGQLSAEGRRVKADIEAGDNALGIIEGYIQAVEGYNPRKVVTLGNHEDRIDRFVSTHPEFEGFIGTDKLAFTTHGWEVFKFLTPVNICGINFVHYVQNVMTGKPLGGTVVSMLKTIGESFVMGHKQVLEHTLRYLPLSGKPQIGIIVGACYDHAEAYKGVQGNHHFRGCVMLYECNDGYAMSKPVSLDHMQRVYEDSV